MIHLYIAVILLITLMFAYPIAIITSVFRFKLWVLVTASLTGLALSITIAIQIIHWIVWLIK